MKRATGGMSVRQRLSHAESLISMLKAEVEEAKASMRVLREAHQEIVRRSVLVHNCPDMNTSERGVWGIAHGISQAALDKARG